MKNVLTISMLTIAALCGCDKSAEKPASKSTPAPTASPPPVPPSTSKPQASAPSGAGHEKEAEHHGDHEVETSLAPVDIAGMSVRPVIHGAVTAGQEAEVDVHVSQGAQQVIAVRMWIGTPDGQGAMKVKATINKEHAHNHVAVPSPLAPGALLCVELELTGGEKKVGTLPLPKP